MGVQSHLNDERRLESLIKKKSRRTDREERDVETGCLKIRRRTQFKVDQDSGRVNCDHKRRNLIMC